ncbi:hypothetical protein LZ30DRAFT_451167 [Colletotrichum cereale]|nr:hypothetical protein LZ30DRAFT_451167 [Colletotrichum cereale]
MYKGRSRRRAKAKAPGGFFQYQVTSAGSSRWVIIHPGRQRQKPRGAFSSTKSPPPVQVVGSSSTQAGKGKSPGGLFPVPSHLRRFKSLGHHPPRQAKAKAPGGFFLPQANLPPNQIARPSSGHLLVYGGVVVVGGQRQTPWGAFLVPSLLCRFELSGRYAPGSGMQSQKTLRRGLSSAQPGALSVASTHQATAEALPAVPPPSPRSPLLLRPARPQ